MMRIYGKNPIIERMKSNPKSIHAIYLQEGHVDEGYIRQKARKWGVSVYSVPVSKIIKMGRSLKTQGILADIDDFGYTPYQDLLEIVLEKKQSLVFLDNVQDPQNLGVVIRSLACLGDFSLVLPERESVSVTEAVLRVASGGDNYIQIAKVPNLAQALDLAKEKGFWIAGAVVEGGKNLMDVTLPFPLGLVMGSEHSGIRDVIRKRLDLALTIPMRQPRLSFNVAQAMTIFCYEIKKQKSQKRKPE